LFFVLRHFYEGATFSTRGQEISSPHGESILHLAEIESPGGGIISAGGRLYKGAIHFGSPALEDYYRPTSCSSSYYLYSAWFLDRVQSMRCYFRHTRRQFLTQKRVYIPNSGGSRGVLEGGFSHPNADVSSLPPIAPKNKFRCFIHKKAKLQLKLRF